MARSGCRARTRRSVFLLGLLAACGACTTTPTTLTPTAPTAPAVPTAPTTRTAPTTLTPTTALAPAFEAGVELPEGPGREILMAHCLSCHGLSALPLFGAFYTRDSWRTLVLTMQGHGAEVDGAEIEVLADYLAQHFGPQSTDRPTNGGKQHAQAGS